MMEITQTKLTIGGGLIVIGQEQDSQGGDFRFVLKIVFEIIYFISLYLCTLSMMNMLANDFNVNY